MEIKIEDKYVILSSLNENLNESNMLEISSMIEKTSKLGEKNFILNFSSVNSMTTEAMLELKSIQKKIEKSKGTFVVFALNNNFENQFKKLKPGKMNVVPLQEEAIDIVFMEEIEREFNN